MGVITQHYMWKKLVLPAESLNCTRCMTQLQLSSWALHPVRKSCLTSDSPNTAEFLAVWQHVIRRRILDLKPVHHPKRRYNFRSTVKWSTPGPWMATKGLILRLRQFKLASHNQRRYSHRMRSAGRTWEVVIGAAPGWSAKNCLSSRRSANRNTISNKWLL